ncbi:MAG: hypothetical protein V1928_04515 [Parcubacteria group bacterium]
MFNLQNFNWRKILMIVAFIGIVIVVGYLLYSLFFKQAAPVTPITRVTPTGQLPSAITGKQPGVTTGEQAATGKLPSEKILKIPAPAGEKIDAVAQGRVTKTYDLSYDKTTSMALSGDGKNMNTYNPDTGQFYQIDANGDKIALTDKIYKNVENVAWAPKNNQAILEFPDGSNVLYNFKTDKQITLPKDWTEFQFNNDGSKIAFKDMNEYSSSRWLAMANPDGSGQKYLEPMGDEANNFIVNWSPSGSVVAEYKAGADADTSKLIFVGQHGENIKALPINGYNVDLQWTPDGNRMLYSASNFQSDNKPLLNVVDASGNNIGYNQQSLGLNTWASKCAFADSSTVYCAVPKELPYGVDFVPELADSVPDYIYKVDLQTGVKSFVAEPEYSYTINKMAVSSDGNTLYFTDNYANALHSIKLK